MASNITRRDQDGDNPLDDTDVHDILRNERRRAVIEILANEGEEESVRELSERIAAAETDTHPPPRDTRQSVYVSLHQTHLPKLQQHGIVEYDVDAKIVRPTRRCERLHEHMAVDSIREYASRHAAFTIVIGTIGAILVVGAWMGVIGLSVVPPALWAAGALAALAISGVYLYLLLNPSFSFRT